MQEKEHKESELKSKKKREDKMKSRNKG